MLELLALALARPFIPPDSNIPWLFVLPAGLIGIALFGGSFVLGSRKARWITRGLAVALLAGAVTAGRARWIIGLRLQALAVLVWIFIEPVWVYKVERELKCEVVVVLDDSGSMQLEDDGSESSRLAIGEAALAKAGIVEKLREKLRVRVVKAARSVRAEGEAMAEGWGDATDLAAALGTVLEIEVGTGLSPRSPLRTERADLPHPALQSAVCSVTEARDFSFSGVQQAKEPELLEVAVAPALVVLAAATAFQTAPLSQDGAQSHADPSVNFSQLAGFDVLEVAEPAGQCPVEVGHNGLHALAVVPARPEFDGFAQLAQAFGPDQAHQPSPPAAFEPVAEEVKMTVGKVQVHRADFVGMQRQSAPGHPLPECFQRGLGFFLTAAQDDHVVGIPHHFHQFFHPPQGVFATASGAESVAVLGEAVFENGLG